jgi:hypothetical protein
MTAPISGLGVRPGLPAKIFGAKISPFDTYYEKITITSGKLYLINVMVRGRIISGGDRGWYTWRPIQEKAI